MNAKKRPVIKPFLVKRGAIVYFRVNDDMPAERARVVSIPRDGWVRVEWLTSDDQCIGKQTLLSHYLFETHDEAMAYHNELIKINQDESDNRLTSDDENNKLSINDELTYWQKQLILYTKGHYGPVNWAFHELKYFAAEFFELDVKHVRQRNVNTMIEVTIETLLKYGAVKSTIWRDMTYQLLRDDHIVKLDNSNRYVSYMLSNMQGVNVIDNHLSLGEVSEEMKQKIKDERQLYM